MPPAQLVYRDPGVGLTAETICSSENGFFMSNPLPIMGSDHGIEL